MLKIKGGVKPVSLTIAAACANAAWDLPWDIVITSGNDSTHMKGSRHYSDAALDIRISNFPSKDALELYLGRVRARLGAGYDVVLESDHIHIEYDPK